MLEQALAGRDGTRRSDQIRESGLPRGTSRRDRDLILQLRRPETLGARADQNPPIVEMEVFS